MLASIAMQPKMMNSSLKPSKLSSQSILLKSHKTPTILSLKSKPSSFPLFYSSFSAAKTFQTTATLKRPLTQHKEKLGVVVKPMEKPRIVLKMIWMERVIGIALNQVIPGHGTIPLSPYYFWPKQDAWDELKSFLESRPWISKKQMAILLNQATDIINLWQENVAR